MHDENVTRTKLVRTRNNSRTKLMRELGRNTKKYRTVIRGLRQAAWDTKNSYKTIYEDKLVHLRCKYRETEQEIMDKIPNEMQEFITLSIFDRKMYGRLEPLTYEVTCVGKVTLNNVEREILRMHPKLSIIDTLQ